MMHNNAIIDIKINFFIFFTFFEWFNNRLVCPDVAKVEIAFSGCKKSITLYYTQGKISVIYKIKP